MILLFFHIGTVLARRLSGGFFEGLLEMRFAFVAGALGNLLDRGIGVLQQILRQSNAAVNGILDWAHVGLFFEDPGKVVFAQADFCGKQFERQCPVDVFFDKALGHAYMLAVIGCWSVRLSQGTFQDAEKNPE